MNYPEFRIKGAHVFFVVAGVAVAIAVATVAVSYVYIVTSHGL